MDEITALEAKIAAVNAANDALRNVERLRGEVANAAMQALLGKVPQGTVDAWHDLYQQERSRAYRLCAAVGID